MNKQAMNWKAGWQALSGKLPAPKANWLKPAAIGVGVGALGTVVGSKALQRLRERKALEEYYAKYGYTY